MLIFCLLTPRFSEWEAVASESDGIHKKKNWMREGEMNSVKSAVHLEKLWR